MGNNRAYDKERAAIKGENDARNDKGAGLVDLITLGMATNSSYNPPKDPELKAHYDAEWEKVKHGK